MTSSTVDEEARLNPRLSKPLPEFVDIMNNLNLGKGEYIIDPLKLSFVFWTHKNSFIV